MQVQYHSNAGSLRSLERSWGKVRNDCQSFGINTTSKIRLPVRHVRVYTRQILVAQQRPFRRNTTACLCARLHTHLPTSVAREINFHSAHVEKIVATLLLVSRCPASCVKLNTRATSAQKLTWIFRKSSPRSALPLMYSPARFHARALLTES